MQHTTNLQPEINIQHSVQILPFASQSLKGEFNGTNRDEKKLQNLTDFKMPQNQTEWRSWSPHV